MNISTIHEDDLTWFIILQNDTIVTSQSFFHNYTPRYTPFKFKKLSNAPNLTAESNYWEGPLNYGLCHAFPAILCAVAMCLALVLSPLWKAEKSTVCLFKCIVSFIGALCLVLVYFEIYGLVGITHLWGEKTLFHILDESQIKICNYIHAFDEPFSTKISTALSKAETALKRPASYFFKNVTGPKYKKALNAYTRHVSVLSKTSYDVDENIGALFQIVEPICTSSVADIPVWIGDRDLANVTKTFQSGTAVHSIYLCIGTIIMAVLVMRVILKKNTFCLAIICILGAGTSMLWWYAAGHFAPWLVGISDFNSRKMDGLMPIIKELNPALTKEKVAVLLQCSHKTQHNYAARQFVEDLYEVNAPIVKIHEASILAIKEGYERFPPKAKKPQYIDFLRELLDLTKGLYPASRHLSKLINNDCTYYKNEFEKAFSILVKEMYWAILVAYTCAYLMALLMTVAVVLLLRIRCHFNYLCHHTEQTEDEPILKCLPECPRGEIWPPLQEPPPLPPVRQWCPATCTGSRKEVRTTKFAGLKKICKRLKIGGNK